MKTGKKLGIYIHLPFCQSKCAYCDFYSLPSGKSMAEQKKEYQSALLTHIALMSPVAEGYQVDTIYFGGGTPTLYGGAGIAALLRGIKKAFRVERTAEITVEGNPESIQSKEIALLRRSGVNRMSMGMQTAVAEELQAIGRPHTPESTRNAVGILKENLIDNLSLDLMYGLPLQTMASWTATVEEAIALEPTHLSCYGLKVEEGTPLYTRVERGEVLPDDDMQAEMYLWAVERLRREGYRQYEISNFAKGKHHSRHNMGYWMGKPYMGFGASASSDFGGYRYTMIESVEEYCRSVLEGGSQIFSSNELMSHGERNQEYIILRLRTSEGIKGQEYEKATGLDFTPIHLQLEEYRKEGWAYCSDQGVWTFSSEGYLRSNTLLLDLLDKQEHSGLAKPTPLQPVAPPSGRGKKNAPVFQEDQWGQLRFGDD